MNLVWSPAWVLAQIASYSKTLAFSSTLLPPLKRKESCCEVFVGASSPARKPCWKEPMGKGSHDEGHNIGDVTSKNIDIWFKVWHKF
jgi:hypothetical protein